MGRIIPVAAFQASGRANPVTLLAAGSGSAVSGGATGAGRSPGPGDARPVTCDGLLKNGRKRRDYLFQMVW
jgi:hypothetical protein